MRKDNIRDYATEAFRFYAACGRLTAAELEEKVRLFLMLPKTVGQAENISGFVKCVGCSVGAVVFGELYLLSKRSSLS